MWLVSQLALDLSLILGGAVVHRCDKCTVLNAALAAEGMALAQK
jgi:hypothetical protein